MFTSLLPPGRAHGAQLAHCLRWETWSKGSCDPKRGSFSWGWFGHSFNSSSTIPNTTLEEGEMAYWHWHLLLYAIVQSTILRNNSRMCLVTFSHNKGIYIPSKYSLQSQWIHALEWDAKLQRAWDMFLIFSTESRFCLFSAKCAQLNLLLSELFL